MALAGRGPTRVLGSRVTVGYDPETRSHREIAVAADKSNKQSMFDPEALLEAQRRNFAAFTNAGNIVADGMRSYAERQVAMMQESMSHPWSVVQSSAAKPSAPAAPAEQMDRMRAAFEKVMAQVNDLGNHLLKVQSEAMAVLNECATRNLEVLGVAAPELAALQQKAKDAFASASTQTSAVIDEMKKRMASLEQDTREAVSPATAAKPAAPAAPKAPAAAAAPARPAPKAEAPAPAAPRKAATAGPKAPETSEATAPAKNRRTGKAPRKA
jgi:methyl-accepting chemotaxis protein